MAQVEQVGNGMMSPRRFATSAALCGTIVLAGWVVAGLAGFGSPGIEHTDAAPIEDRPATSLTVRAVDAPRATAIGEAAVSGAIVATADPPEPAVVPAAVPVADTALVEAALPPSSPTLPPETPPVQVATASTPDPGQNDAQEAVRSIETLDECLVADICIDQYLWSVYQRTPKLDTIKVHEQRKVTVKKNGKTRTVTKSFTKLVDEDFTWKDPNAAEKAGMPLMGYVIGGMDRSFKLKLYHALRVLDDAGLAPGMTSGFRDDYRQSIASGLKASTDRSYHGGSFRGGYGHGLAADIVSVKGETRAQRLISSESLWKWIDAHGKEFGIGRPYLDKDPAHVAPIDGKEYVAHRGGANARHAGSETKKRRDDHGMAKRAKTERSSKARII